MKNLASALGFGLLLSFGLVGCADEIDELFDCSQICNRYEECIDGDYDVDGCIDRCETNADEEEGFAERADNCETCLDGDDSCAESLPCADDCVGIVP